MRNVFFIVFTAVFLFSCRSHRLSLEDQQAATAQSDSLRALAKEARETADFRTALLLADSAADIAIQWHDTIRIVQAMNELGTNFRRMGRLMQAIQTHSEALRYAELCTDTSFQARKNLVVSWNGLGNALLTIGEDNNAESAFRYALQGEKQLGSLLGQAINYANLGSILVRRNQLDSALYYYNQSMTLNRQINSVVGMGLCHIYFGEIHELRGNRDSALIEYQAAADLFVGQEDIWHAIEPTLAMAGLYLKDGNISHAAPLIEKAYQMAHQMNSIEHLLTVHQLSSQIYEMQGKCQLALNEYKQMMLYSDSLNNPQHDREMREIVIQYQMRKHQQQLEKEHQEAARTQRLYNITIALGTCLFILTLIFLAHLLRSSYHKVTELMERLRRAIRQNDMTPPVPGTLSQADKAFLEQLHNYVEQNLETGNCSIETIAEFMGLSLSSLTRRVRLLTGDTPKTYVQNIRMERAINMLKNTNLPLRTIAEKCGFEDMSYFSRSIKKYSGKVPSQLRNN